MAGKYMQRYIDLSGNFRKSNGSNQSAEDLFDLLYEIKNTEKTKEDNLILSNIYTLLSFHESAYAVFKDIADKSNKKDNSKLFVMEEKAKSHKDIFALKDLRKLRQKKEKFLLEIDDFKADTKYKNTFSIVKEVIIFNKTIKADSVGIILPTEDLKPYFETIISHLNWLSDCKTELISNYNKKDFEEKADNDWYDSLEIYRTSFSIEENGIIITNIASGDSFYQDHLLDIEIENREFVSFGYDG